MSTKKLFILFVSAYLILCSVLIFKSGIFSEQQNANGKILTLASEANQPAEDKLPQIASQPDEPADTTRKAIIFIGSNWYLQQKVPL